MLQILTKTLRTSPEIWGEDSSTFNTVRFLPSTGEGENSKEATKEYEKLRKKALNPFGDGAHLCPVRHFAPAEIMGLAALLVVGYDLTTKDGSVIEILAAAERAIYFSESVVKPSAELQKSGVTVRRRRGWKDVVWKLKVGHE
jgi:cytochrome P450